MTFNYRLQSLRITDHVGWSKCQSITSCRWTRNRNDAGSLQTVDIHFCKPISINSFRLFFFSTWRMTTACHKKCVVPKYKDSELTKGRFSFWKISFIQWTKKTRSRWINLYRSMCGQIHGSKIFYFSLAKSLFRSLFRYMIELVNN